MSFYESICRYYDSIFPDSEIKYQFLNSIEDISTCSGPLLDIGCATGGFAVRASGKRRVFGIDSSACMIKIARKKALKGNPEFSVLDMTDTGRYFLKNTFSAVTCFGNTLVHLPDMEGVAGLFSNVYKILKCDGLFLIQILNYERIYRLNIKELTVIENPEIKFERFYDFKEDKNIDFKTVLRVKKTGRILKNLQRLYGLRKDELIDLLGSAGFNNIKAYGSFRMEPYSDEGNNLIISCSPAFKT